MLYNALTPAEYLDVLENDWRKTTLEEIRDLLLLHLPNFEEVIHYKMLSYKDKQGHIFHLNAQKNYVSLYLGDASKVDPDGSLLKGLNVGKGCIRFTKSQKVADTNIEVFIKKSLELWIAGIDIGC